MCLYVTMTKDKIESVLVDSYKERKKIMKKIISMLLAGAMSVSMASAYAEGMNFADVTESDWFYNDVKSAYEIGLVSGKGENAYAPKDNLTYAEAIKLAACMNQLYTEKVVTLEAGTPWYQSFVDYCANNGITDKEYAYTENATREGYMEIFANALPAEGLAEVNYIPDGAIPDVPMTSEYAAGIYKLYRAGILTGVDDAHNCSPDASITRGEVAAILTRMMDAEKRVKFDMGEKPEETPVENTEEKVEEKVEEPEATGFRVTKNPESVDIKVGELSEFTVEVAGNQGVCDYQWQYKSGEQWIDLGNTGTTIMDATSECLKLYAQEAMEMVIRCEIDNKGDKIYSEEATVVVTAWE